MFARICDYSEDACRYNDATVWLSRVRARAHSFTRHLERVCKSWPTNTLLNTDKFWGFFSSQEDISAGLVSKSSWNRVCLEFLTLPRAMYESVDVVGLTPNPFLSVDYYHHHHHQQQQQKRGCLIQDKGMPRSFVPWSSSHCRWPLFSSSCFFLSRACARDWIPFLLESNQTVVWLCSDSPGAGKLPCSGEKRTKTLPFLTDLLERSCVILRSCWNA